MFDKLFDKKKLNFWRLAFLFGGLTIITLFLLWNSPQQPKAQMMQDSMGNMMKQMHVSNIKIYDLLKNGEMQNQSQGQTNEMGSHHQNQASVVYKLNFLSTAIIFFLLPLIIGGSIILAIVWIK
jgi:hypothetical protein